MSQLRSYSAYGVTSKVVATHGCSLVSLDGVYHGAGAEYLVIFDAAALPANGTAPLKEFFLPTAGPTPLPSLFQTLGPIKLNTGCVIAISTSKETLTASASEMDVHGEIEEFEFPIVGATFNSVSQDSVQVWADGDGPKRILRFTGTNTDAAASYIQLFAHSPNADDVPLHVWPIGAFDGANPTLKLSFGDGYIPYSREADGTEHNGCYFAISSDPTKYIAVSAVVDMEFYYR
jgi:hypothetical protein